MSAQRITMKMEFTPTFERRVIEEYLKLLADYCNISPAEILVSGFKQGSTIVDFIIRASTSLTDVLRFLKYSLSMATITLNETNKLRMAYGALKSEPARFKRTLKPRIPKLKAKIRKENSSESVANEIIGARLEESRSMEIFVDKAKERVLIVDGKVKITIILG
jgi:hypothetical protein